MTKYEDITVGTDPEVFLESKKSGIISAIGLVGGTKENPIPVTKGALQEDNVLAEFNIDPAHSPKEFITNIKTVMSQLENKVNPHKLRVLSSHRFTQSMLESLGEKALTFGCDPDINAWDGETNESPSAYTTLRTAGGHVHVGFKVDKEDSQTRFNVIKLMDIYLGIPSVLLDGDTERRSMYGKAGACRIKEYGVEYRTLSNFWLQSEKHMKWVYSQSIRAVKNKDYVDEIIDRYSSDEIQNTINNSDVEKAESIVSDLQLELV